MSGKENEDDDEIVKDSEDAKEEDENECMVEAVDFEGDVLETDDAVAVVAFAVVAFGGWPPFGLLAAGPHSTVSGSKKYTKCMTFLRRYNRVRSER